MYKNLIFDLNQQENILKYYKNDTQYKHVDTFVSFDYDPSVLYLNNDELFSLENALYNV